MVVPQASINNIMGGIESTGGVRLHNHRRKLKQRFDIVRKLGQGNYGKVQLGINKETGQEVAIKTIKKCKIETEADLIRIRREIQIMSSVRHPNIIHIYEVFENREKMVLVMEYAAGGELYDFLDQKKVLTEEEARQIFRQIATAVYYCHKHKICHRDLKLENILLDENGNAKIADFGLSNVFTESRFLSTFCGSPLYASPEIVKGIPYHGPEVDCWSLGVLLYTLVYGAMPFDGSNFKRLVKQISNGDYFEPKNQSTASPLIAEMLNVNPSSRADITVICSHWWIDKDQSVPCLEEAEELANQTPVRLDLLLSLAPSVSSEKIVVGVDPGLPQTETSQQEQPRPLRSQSLGNIPPIMESPLEPLATNHAQPTIPEKPEEKTKADSGVAGTGFKRKDISTTQVNKTKRDRSSSRSRRKESEKENVENNEQSKPKTATLEEPKGLVQEPITPVAETPKQVDQESTAEEIYPDEQAIETLTPNTPDPLVSEPITPLPVSGSAPETQSKVVEEKPQEEPKPPSERRRSSVLETVEKFNKQPAPPKKIIIPGAMAKKVYERKPSNSAITRTSLSDIPNKKVDSPPPAEFCLASTVNLNKLAEQALSSPETDTDVVQPSFIPTRKESSKQSSPEDDEKTKKVRNAVKVIGNVLGSSDSIDKKSSTLPRRKSKADFVQPPFVVPNKPSEFRSEIRHMVNSPPTVTQRTEVTFPVAAAPKPAPAVRQESQPREHIIPIKFEREDVPAPTRTPPPAQTQTPPPVPTSGSGPIRKSSSQQSQQNISRTSSRSLSRQSTCDSDSSICSSGDPIRKSAREVIIPIAVEGGGFITPSATALNRINSITESEDDGSASGAPRCFTLRSTRRARTPQTKPSLETAESVSSDEDDDNFEILTAENLFSTLLSRVRSLTQRLNTDEHRNAFPRSIFSHGHSIFDNPPRLSETRSFNRADGIHPWRRSLSREPMSGSSSTLPRDRSKSSTRNLNNQPRDEKSTSLSNSMYRSRLRPPITIKNSLSKQLIKERLNELDGIDKTNETKLKSRHKSTNINDYVEGEQSINEPYIYKMRTRQRTNGIETYPQSPVENPTPKPQLYQMKTRNRTNSSESNTTEVTNHPNRIKRPLSIHESFDSSKVDSPVARRIYQRSFSCDRNKINAILKDSAKILENNGSDRVPSAPVTTAFRRTNSLRQPTILDKKKEYRRSLSANTTNFGNTSVMDSYTPNTSLDRVISPTRKIPKYYRSSMYDTSEPNSYSRYYPNSESRSMRESSVGPESSRIKSTIRSLRESSVGADNSIDSESNLIKRAISLESKSSLSDPKGTIQRTQSLKQNSGSDTSGIRNVYKDFISKIVNARDGNVSRSIFNDRSTRSKYGLSRNNSSNNTSEKESDNISEKYENKDLEQFGRNSTIYKKENRDIENGDEKPAHKISRFLKTNRNEKTDFSSGSKLPTRLAPNTEPVLLRNRRYSIPRLQTKDKNSREETNPSHKTNGYVKENGVFETKPSGSKTEVNMNCHLDDTEKSLDKVEKVINNLEMENARKVERAESISKLKRLDLSKISPSPNQNDLLEKRHSKPERASTSQSLDHCDNSSRGSFLSPTVEDSDGWSVCSDVTDARGDCPSPSSPSSAHEETVSERIRRKSFFSRFNPAKNSPSNQSNRIQMPYTRSSSADTTSGSPRNPKLLKSTTKTLLKE